MKPGLYETLERIALTINERKNGDPAKSYVAQLFAKGEDAMLKKIGEEATETLRAAKRDEPRQDRTRRSASCWVSPGGSRVKRARPTGSAPSSTTAEWGIRRCIMSTCTF